ncbi:hypothetical protein THUN1379_23530 [Paludibacterium sp. THUN1379]|uniref:translocation/assembly module TamB domain-containing protein n=1 Tax=Paludibacterium sp. THUN1379 TaxID=3112107 RepID=UPI00308B2C7A|nr:hypothetical protein THUN1379_23530 [Paludibacterium sp. THUN1379]
MPHEPNTTPPPAPATAAPRRTRHAGWWLLLLPCLLLLAGYWFTATERGFRQLCQSMVRLSGGQLQVATASGTLWQGFSLQDVQWRDAAMTLTIDHLRLDWQPARLWQGQLSVQTLSLGLVHYTANPSAPPSPWPSLPGKLSLPLQVELANIHLDGLSLSPGDWSLYDLNARYRYQHGRHQLTLARLRLPQGALHGQLSLADQAPFALSGRLQGAAGPGSSDLTLSGNLRQLLLRGQVRASPVVVDLSGRFDPFASQPSQRVQQLELHTVGVDPQAINAHWPRAVLDMALSVQPAGQGHARGRLQLTNRMAGAASQGRLPLDQVQADFLLDPDSIQVRQLQATLGAGRLLLDGQIHKDRLHLNLRLQDLDPHALHAAIPADAISGAASLNGQIGDWQLRAGLKGRQLALQLQSTLSYGPARPWQWQLQRGVLSAGSGELTLQGQLDANRRFKLNGKLQHGDPHAVADAWPRGDLNASLSASGRADQPLAADLLFDIAPSKLDGAPVGGHVRFSLAGHQIRNLAADLNLAGNTLQAQGAWGAAGDQLQAKIQAPVLARIGFGLSGSAQGQVTLSGTPAQPLVALDLSAHQIRLPGLLTAQNLAVNGNLQAGGSGVFRLKALAEQVSGNHWRIDQLRLNSDGNRARHRLVMDARLALGNQAYQAQAALEGGLAASQPDWRGNLQSLRISGQPALQLLSPLSIHMAPGILELGATRFSLAGAQISFAGLTRQRDGSLSSHGRLDGLALAALKPWLDLPGSHDLVVGGSWALQPDGHGSLSIERQSGDMTLDAGNRAYALALGQTRARIDWSRDQTAVDVLLAAGVGQLQLRGKLSAAPWRLNAATPLSASLKLDLPHLASLAALSDLAETGGSLSADLALSGPLGNPQARGPIQGRELLLRDRRTGLRLAGGTLAARLEGHTLWLDQLRFVSGQGEAKASGQLRLNDSDGTSMRPDAAVRVEIRQFSVFDRPDRVLVVSGNANLSVNDKRIALTGRVHADQGRLDLPKAGTPALSDDVMVIGRPVPQSALASLPVSVELLLDLGNHFAFSGPGLNVELSGQVKVSAQQGMAPSARGQVNVVKGRYKAYGQELDIDAGTITFVGPLDNPNLNVRARRRMSPVGAGVEVLGSVSQPRLQLIADDAMTDRDKLSWLVLGRAADDSTQDSNFLALAASQLAAGSLNDKVGLFDDLGLTRKESKTLLNGTVSPAEQVLTVGKQLSRTFYLGYEYGLTSSQQALKLMYQLSGKWSLLLRLGNNASAESRYTLRFD